jgi:hypothetical protein
MKTKEPRVCPWEFTPELGFCFKRPSNPPRPDQSLPSGHARLPAQWHTDARRLAGAATALLAGLLVISDSFNVFSQAFLLTHLLKPPKHLFGSLVPARLHLNHGIRSFQRPLASVQISVETKATSAFASPWPIGSVAKSPDCSTQCGIWRRLLAHPFSRAPEDQYSDPAGSATVDIRTTIPLFRNYDKTISGLALCHLGWTPLRLWRWRQGLIKRGLFTAESAEGAENQFEDAHNRGPKMRSMPPPRFSLRSPAKRVVILNPSGCLARRPKRLAHSLLGSIKEDHLKRTRAPAKTGEVLIT